MPDDYEDDDMPMVEGGHRAKKRRETMSASRVLARSRWLESNSEHSKTVEKMRERWQLHSMLEVPPVSPTVTRGQAVIVNSPRIMQTKKTLQSDLLSYETKVSVTPHVPHGETRSVYERKAERIEKPVVLAKDELNDGRRVDRATIEHLLISSYCCWVFECRDCYDEDDEDAKPQWCWYLDVPAPDTCFFRISGAPVRPQEFARHYKATLGDLRDKYSGQKQGDHAGKKLWRDGKKEWHFEAISDDHATDGIEDASSNEDPEGEYADCEVVAYYDATHIYHVLVDGDTLSKNSKGTIVYCEENRVKGGPPVVILSGGTSEIRGERLQPFLWAVMQIVKTLNLIDTIRATIFYNLKPDVLIEHAPQELQALLDAGYVRPATQLQLQDGVNLVDIGGKVHFWEMPSSDDMDKLEGKKIDELNDYLQQIQAITSYEVISKSTANLGLLAAGNVEIQQGPMLSSLDWAWAQVLQMWLDSVADYDEEFELYAKPGSRHSKGEFAGGEGISISPDMLDGWSWQIYVETSNKTAAIIRARLEDWARGNELRGRPLEELGEVLGYSNRQEWKELMAKDDGLRLAAPLYSGFVQAVIDAKLLLKGGINAGALREFYTPAEPTALGGGGATMQPMRPPETAGATGGSGAGGGVAA